MSDLIQEWEYWIESMGGVPMGELETVAQGLATLAKLNADRIEALETAINTALDAVAAYPDHPMTAAEVVLRDALNDLAIPRYVEGE